MPGLCGIVMSSGDAVDDALVSRLRDVNHLDSVEAFGDVYLRDGCLLANFYNAPAYRHPLRSDCARIGSKVLMLEGRIFNIADLKGAIGHEACTTTEILLRMYLDLGIEFLDKLSGEFSIAIYDSTSHEATICADHLASQPLYFTQTNNAFVFGAEQKMLLALSDQQFDVDPVGLLQSFAHIHNLGDRTFVRSVRRLEAGQVVTANNSKLSVLTRDLMPLQNPEARQSTGVLEQWAELLRQATAARIEPQQSLLISLSAGLDSRAIACSIDRDHRPLLARTWGVEDSTEVTLASKIADRLGFTQVLEDPGRTRYSDALDAVVWRTEGESPLSNNVSIFGHRKVLGKCDYVTGGWMGDASSGAHLRPFMFRPRSKADFVEALFNWYLVHSKASLANVFQEDFVSSNYDELRDAFRDSFTRFSDCDNLSTYEYWDLYHRQTRMTTSSMPVDSYIFEKVRPFYDKDYLSFVMSLPKSWRIGQSYYRSMIQMIGPEIRDIPDSNTDLRLRGNPKMNLVGYLWASRHKAYKKIARQFGRTYQRGSFISVQNKGGAVRDDTRLRERLESFLASEYFDDAIFDRSSITQMLDQHYSGRSDHSDLIIRLATASVALQYFVYERPSRCPEGANPLKIPEH